MIERVLKNHHYTKTWQALKCVQQCLTYQSFQSQNSSQPSGWLDTSLVGWMNSNWEGAEDLIPPPQRQAWSLYLVVL